jgi:CheY-like chemotaxis protein
METVLVLEDDKPLREVLCNVLETAGFLILQSSSAEEALPLIETKQIDCILSDFKLGGMSGIELVKKVRELKPLYLVLS